MYVYVSKFIVKIDRIEFKTSQKLKELKLNIRLKLNKFQTTRIKNYILVFSLNMLIERKRYSMDDRKLT